MPAGRPHIGDASRSGAEGIPATGPTPVRLFELERLARPMRASRRKALSDVLAISTDPDFVAGAKDALCGKAFDYARRDTKAQLRYEDGRLAAVRLKAPSRAS